MALRGFTLPPMMQAGAGATGFGTLAGQALEEGRAPLTGMQSWSAAGEFSQKRPQDSEYSWQGAVGGLAAVATATGLAARRSARAMAGRRGVWRTLRRDSLSLVKTPKGTFDAMVDKGVANSEMSALKTLFSSYMGGCYVGMAGLLSLAISGNMGTPTMGLQKFVFAALFPVNLLLVLQSGAQLFTGNTATLSMALFEGRIGLGKLIRSWVLSYIGNIIGCGLLAVVASYTGLLSLGTADLAVATALKKVASGFGPTIVKAIMCNWLVCMAVFLATSANDLAGKMVGIWFPISMFVAIGFEHSVANMFLLPAGLLAGAPISLMDVIVKNMIPVTIGNAIAGAFVIGAGFSFSVGKLGAGK